MQVNTCVKGEKMYDETQLKIIDATMSLIIDKGYSGATTKTIAKDAGVNESTIFRRFNGKKEIVLAAMELPKWNPDLKESDFVYEGSIGFQKCTDEIFPADDRLWQNAGLRCRKSVFAIYCYEFWLCFFRFIIW